MKNNKARLLWFLIFLSLTATEVLIALFVNDRFVRPYVGDIIVVAVICAFFRIFFPAKPITLPVWITLFAISVEILQYFDFVKILGLENSRILSVALGRTFDAADIICYVIGGAAFFFVEFFLRKHISSREK